MNNEKTDLNRRLAPLLGWTNIIELGGALLGTPPAGQPHCRGQAQVPNWAGDWRDCGPLIGQYGMSVGRTALDAIATCRGLDLYGPGIEAFADHESEDAAMRSAIVSSVIAKLEANQ